MKKIYLLLVVALPLTARAGSRSSANYVVPADTVDAGGARAASAHYTIDGSLGGIGGIGTAPTPAESVKHSYIGQLYEVSNLTLAADPATVDEGGTRQLTASAALDDGTFLGLPGSQVAWSVTSGPLSGVDASGLVHAEIVYQDSPATVGGAFGGKSGQIALNVVNTNIDNFGTYAGDGVDDAWQVQYFGLNNPSAAGGADPDGDGQNNQFEYIAGTVPTDASSKFLFGVSNVPGISTAKDLTFSPRLASRTYNIQYARTPVNADFAPLGGSSTTDTGPVRSVRDNNATNDFRFYRVFISFP